MFNIQSEVLATLLIYAYMAGMYAIEGLPIAALGVIWSKRDPKRKTKIINCLAVLPGPYLALNLALLGWGFWRLTRQELPAMDFNPLDRILIYMNKWIIPSNVITLLIAYFFTRSQGGRKTAVVFGMTLFFVFAVITVGCTAVFCERGLGISYFTFVDWF